MPTLVQRLIHDLAPHPAYVLNLRWDVLAYNAPAELIFGFAAHPPERRNLLWLLFTDPLLRERFVDWQRQAAQMLASFRQDFARALQDADAQALVEALEACSPAFAQQWRQQDIQASCSGARSLNLDGTPVRFEHTTLTLDGDRHLRLVVYARMAPEAATDPHHG